MTDMNTLNVSTHLDSLTALTTFWIPRLKERSNRIFGLGWSYNDVRGGVWPKNVLRL